MKILSIPLKQTFILSPIFLISLILSLGCTSKVEKKKVPALFETRREAEKAAKSFNCNGAHKMGDKWMPCSTHEAHENSHNKNQKGHNHHHHNH